MSIDLSNHLDRVDNCFLGQKLVGRGVSGNVALVLMHYLRDQSANVVWRRQRSRLACRVGISKGGYSLAFSFNLYKDEIIIDAVKLSVVCALAS